jgi:glutathione-regulated potassium-efflux system ancillary protein KefC/glutathione-regulated potassium-efflux system protein KefB
MHSLQQVAVYLLTAVLVVPLFKRLKLGAVLGYLAAGIAIGPFGFAIAGGNVQDTLELAEFGVVLLLFLVGLELEPRRLWVLRRPVFGMGGAQVAACGLALGALAWAVGLPWRAALIAGLGLAMSSTALVLASLSERSQLASRHGREAFAILLFQDLAVIPLLALLPLLSGMVDHSGEGDHGWVAAAKGLAVIVAVVLGSRVVVRPVLKAVAQYGGREVFTAASLFLVVGAALLMTWIGLSMSLGAFLAGVLLADSEFRHELEADIEPFKGLLMGLFFIAIGMSANLGLLWQRPLAIVGMALALVAVKWLVMYVLSRLSGGENAPALRLAAALAQGGEFAFVLFSTAAGMDVIDAESAQVLNLVVTLSMLAAPLVFLAQDRAVDPWLEKREAPQFDLIDGPGNPVIIAGFGRMGQVISRLLRVSGIPFTALEASYQQVDFVRRFGAKVYYGDASRLELLQAARAGEAKLLILAIDDVEASVRTAEVVRRHFPDLPIIARARNRNHYFHLRDLGIQNIFRETFPSSIDMARLALLRLGMSPAVAERAVGLFKRHDEEQLEAQYAVYNDEEALIQTTQQTADQLQDLFESDGIYLNADKDQESAKVQA